MKLYILWKGLQTSLNRQTSLPAYQEMNLQDMNRNGASRFNLVRLAIPEEATDPPRYDSLYNVHKL